MNGYVGIEYELQINFPAIKAGLTTIGYQLKSGGVNVGGRIAVGIFENGNGSYGFKKTFSSPFAGAIEADTGDADIKRCREEINIIAVPSAGITVADIEASTILAKAAAVAAIPTTPLLAANYTAPPTVTAIRQEIDANSTKLDATISSRLSAAGYTAPDNTNIANILAVLVDTNYGLARLDAELDALTVALGTLATNTDVQTILTRLTATRAGLLDNLQYLSAASPTAAQIADAVWDEPLTGHTIPDTTGPQLQAAGAAGDPWATLLPGTYDEGTAGQIMSGLIIPDYTGPVVVIPAPTITGTQTLYGYTIDANGVLTAGVTVSVTATGKISHINESLILQLPKSVTSNSVGFWSIPVVKTVEYNVIAENNKQSTITVTSDNTRALTAYI